MANSILKLKVESSEYDAKLKKAAEGIRHLADVAHRSAGDVTGLSKAELDYVKGLGSMETKSRTAAGSVRELESTFKELTVVYNHLNDVEKEDEGGKALRASLDQIKQRAQEARAEIENASKSLQGVEANSKGGGIFDSFLSDKVGGALSVFGGNLMTKGFEMATGAAMTFVNAIRDAAAQGLEMAKQGEGIRIAFERLNQPGLLDELNNATHGTVTNLELMKAAVKFNDFNLPLSQMGTLLAFAQQKAKDTGQSVDYMVDSIVTGLGRKSLMILDNLGLSASEIKERMKETGDMTTAVADIIRDRMQEAGDYVETAADRAAQADKELKDAMTDLGRALIPLEQDGVSMWNALEVGAIKLLTNGVNKVTPALLELKDTIGGIYDTITESKAWEYYTTALSTVTSKAAEAIPVLGQLWKLIKGMSGDGTDAAGGAAIGAVLQDIAPKKKDGQTGGGENSGGKKTAPKDDFVEIVGLIGNAQERVSDIQRQIRESWDEGEIAKLTDDLRAAEEELKRLKEIGKDVDGGQLTELVVRGNPMVSANKKLREAPTNLQSIGDYYAAIKSALKDVNIGTELYNQLSEQLRDTTTVSTLLQELMERGMAGADLESTAQILKEKLLSPDGIDQEAVQAWLEQLNKQIEEAGGVGLKLNSETGEVTDDNKKNENDLTTAINKATVGINALSNINSGLKGMGIDLGDDIGNAIGYVQSLMTVIQGVQAIVSMFQTPAIVTNTFALETLTSTLIAKSFLPGFANGGIVPALAHGGLIGRAAAGMMIPGNSMSGDRLRLPVDGGRGMIGVNSGELILNKSSQNTLAASLMNAEALIDSIKDYSVSLGNAQQTILAQELEGGGYDNIQLEAVIGAEEIMLVTNNRGNRTQRGEYVQSNNRRG